MCRILVTDSRTFLKEAEETLKLGGPDDQNRVDQNGVIFFHTRLSIQGIGNLGKQPVIKNNIILLLTEKFTIKPTWKINILILKNMDAIRILFLI